MSGTAIGALLLTILPEYLRAVDQYRLILYSLLLIILMLLRPKGIFGHEELSRAWLSNQIQGARTLPARLGAWFRSLPGRFSSRSPVPPRRSQ